jgi:hypothetical protein
MNLGAISLRIGLYAFPLSFNVYIHQGVTYRFSYKFFAGKYNSGIKTKDGLV